MVLGNHFPVVVQQLTDDQGRVSTDFVQCVPVVDEICYPVEGTGYLAKHGASLVEKEGSSGAGLPRVQNGGRADDLYVDLQRTDRGRRRGRWR